MKWRANKLSGDNEFRFRMVFYCLGSEFNVENISIANRRSRATTEATYSYILQPLRKTAASRTPFLRPLNLHNLSCLFLVPLFSPVFNRKTEKFETTYPNPPEFVKIMPQSKKATFSKHPIPMPKTYKNRPNLILPQCARILQTRFLLYILEGRCARTQLPSSAQQ